MSNSRKEEGREKREEPGGLGSGHFRPGLWQARVEREGAVRVGGLQS